MLQQAEIRQVHEDAATGVRTYALTFSNVSTREGVCRHDIRTLGLRKGDVVLAQRDGAWTNAFVDTVQRDAATGVLMYNIKFQASSSGPGATKQVAITDLRTPVPRYNIDFRSPIGALSVGGAVLAMRATGSAPVSKRCTQTARVGSRGTTLN